MKSFKKILRKILLIEVINKFIIFLFKPFISLLNESLVSRVPVFAKIKIRIDNAKYFYMVSKGDDEIASRLFFKGIKGYEYPSINFLNERIISANRNNDSFYFFDIGANSGLFSLYAATMSSNNSQVYAFEPNNRARNRLEENCKANGFNNINILPYAISKNSGKCLFTNSDTHLGISTTNKMLTNNQISKEQVVEVQMYSLDDFIVDNSINKIDLIKIDVEGFELEILNGSQLVLSKLRPYLIVEILDKVVENYITDFLNHFNYKKIINFDLKPYDRNQYFIPGEKETDFN